MFIQTEQTPNPASLKFLPGCEVMVTGTAEFTDAATAAAQSPLAERLFAINGVAGVFLGHDFITVTKSADAEWDALKPSVLGAVMEHFTTGQKVMLNEDAGNAGHAVSHDAEDEVVQQIKDILDERIRPIVAQDGGDIVFADFKDGVVYLYMRGACAGCPSSTATLKSGIENMLRHFIPEVVEVRAMN